MRHLEAVDDGHLAFEPAPPGGNGGVSADDDRVRMLFIAVNDAEARLTLDEEHHAIRQSLDRSKDCFVFESVLGLRLDELGRELSNHSPHVVHFGGHGTRAGELLLKAGDGSVAGLTPSALRSLLSENAPSLKLVVLNACFSDEHAVAACGVAGIAIGMNRQIADEAAVAFSRTLYERLGDASSVAEAFRKARAEIVRTKTPGDAKVPRLHIRDGVDPWRVRLVHAPATRRSPKPSRIPIILLAILAILVMTLGAAHCPPRDPGREFSIKVKLVDSAGQPRKVSGQGRLEIGAYTRTVRIDSSDLIEFDQLPHRLAGSDAVFTLDSHAFRLASPNRRYPVEIDGIVDLVLTPVVTRISGTVSFAGSPVPAGRISIAGSDCTSEIHDGFFEIPCMEIMLPVKVQVREPSVYSKRVCAREFVLQQLTNNEVVLGACVPPPPPCPRSAEELIRREAELVVRRDLAGLIGLFAPSATLSDAQTGVAQSPGVRYRAEFAKHGFVTASHAAIRHVGSDGRVWLYTSSSAGRLTDGGSYDNPAESDHWVLEKTADCWRIRSLTINAAGQPFGL